MKELLKERFARLYKGCILFAIHLDGFTHTVYYKDERGARHIARMSFCANEIYTPEEEAYSEPGKRFFYSFNLDRTKSLFLGFPHHEFRGNAKELVYRGAESWVSEGLVTPVQRYGEDAQASI